MNVVFVFPSSSASRQALVRTINKSCKVEATYEDACIVCKVGDPAKAAPRLADLAGVDSVAIARKVSSRFSDLTAAIVQEGIRAIGQGERFYVKVIMESKADYVDRDVEFASTGTLVGKLAEINALPAKSEKEADRVILAVVGKRSAYVCVKGKT
jgi:adenylyl- and sulfurtransferase ThiI